MKVRNKFLLAILWGVLIALAGFIVVYGVSGDDGVPEACENAEDAETLKECNEEVGFGPVVPSVEDRYSNNKIYLDLHVATAEVIDEILYVDGVYGFRCGGRTEVDVSRHGNQLIVRVYKPVSASRACSATEKPGNAVIDLSDYHNIKKITINDEFVLELEKEHKDD